MDEHPKSRRSSQVIFTNKARCRDCYRCLRACPVKAIRMHEGQAYVESDRCIACGTCIRECPQGAKNYRVDISEVERLLASPEPVAVSLAPSFVAAWTQWERRRLPSALRQLGFRYVAETAVGAYFLGGLNGAIIASKQFFKKDVRNYGSHNAGLSNFYRTFGLPGLAVVLLTDIGKSVLSILLGYWLLWQAQGSG